MAELKRHMDVLERVLKGVLPVSYPTLATVSHIEN
jgi:hypothetical protein